MSGGGQGRDLRLARGLQLAPAAFGARDESTRRVRRRVAVGEHARCRRLSGGRPAGAPRPSPLRLALRARLRDDGRAAHLAARTMTTSRRTDAPAVRVSDRFASYLCRDPYPPTLTRGGPTNGVRSTSRLEARELASLWMG